jgi:hypothetical protein
MGPEDVGLIVTGIVKTGDVWSQHCRQMVEYQVGDTVFEIIHNSSNKFSRAQAQIFTKQ